MQDYRVELDAYHGPLDLLLHLIRRNEVDIHDIPIAPIAEQYLAYVKTIRRLDINLAGEFLVMAATLMEIKSAMMAPADRPTDEDGQELSAAEDPTDPRYELIQQLLAYRRYKDAAEQLDEQREAFEARFAAHPTARARQPAEDDQQVELDLEDVSLWDLVEAYNRITEQVGLTRAHEVVADDTPVELHAADLVDRLEREGPMTLQQVFEGRRHGEMVGLFLATLELVRQRRLRVTQPARDAIHLELRPADEAEAEIAAEADAPDRPRADPTNADEFDWPDEQTRRRYERRQQRRARGEVVEEDAELEADIAELEAEQGNAADDDDDDTGDED